MSDRFGLKESVITAIRGVFSRFPEIESAILYGSRAKGNYRPGSDIDITLKTRGESSLDLLYRIMDAIEQLDLIYSFDLSLYEQIDNPNLIDHIQRVGVEFYRAESSVVE
jgi:type I restriction enzyme R subunit